MVNETAKLLSFGITLLVVAFFLMINGYIVASLVFGVIAIHPINTALGVIYCTIRLKILSMRGNRKCRK